VSGSYSMDATAGGQSLKIMLFGAAGFWLPDTFLHALGANRMFSWYDPRILTIVLPLTFLATFLALRRLKKGVRPQHLGLLMLAGVWIFGVLPMMIGDSFAGARFIASIGVYLSGLLLLLSLLPVYTFVMATYDGSQFALALVALATLVAWLGDYFGRKLSRSKSGTSEILSKAA